MGVNDDVGAADGFPHISHHSNIQIIIWTNKRSNTKPPSKPNMTLNIKTPIPGATPQHGSLPFPPPPVRPPCGSGFSGTQKSSRVWEGQRPEKLGFEGRSDPLPCSPQTYFYHMPTFFFAALRVTENLHSFLFAKRLQDPEPPPSLSWVERGVRRSRSCIILGPTNNGDGTFAALSFDDRLWRDLHLAKGPCREAAAVCPVAAALYPVL